MREKGVTPDKRHYAMAMFTCVTSGQHTIAESIFSSFLRGNNSPDTALYTLLLRALLQQKKWAEGSKLFNQMLEGTDETSRANIQTINCFMQYQVSTYSYGSYRNCITYIYIYIYRIILNIKTRCL